MDQDNVKDLWMRRAMSLPVMQSREQDKRRWDKLTPARRAAEHERYELVCADIDRLKRGRE